MPVWVYVIRSLKTDRTYVGITSRLRQRLKEHNSGKNRSTAGGEPYAIILKEQFPDHSAAREQEKFLKSGQGRKYLSELLSKRPQPAGENSSSCPCLKQA